MYEIVPHLYLSSYQDAQTVPKDFFVINCSKDLPMVSTEGGGTRLYVDDAPHSLETMKRNLPLMVKYIEDHVNKGHNVLVHCFAGQQRSATVVAAYLIKNNNMSVDEAISYIKSKKPDAFYGGVHFLSALSPNSV
jgi:protein tyrosine phosphatase